MEKTKLKAILADLTLAEKVGQLVQVTPDFLVIQEKSRVQCHSGQ